MSKPQRTHRSQIIETKRLRLIPLSADMLRSMLSTDYESAEAVAGFAIPKDQGILPLRIARRHLRMIEDDSSQFPWLVRAVVIEENLMVGNVGFHHKAPDPDLQAYCELGVELGYSICPAYRRNGYAREAAQALMQWAQQNSGVASFFLSISPNNAPSLALAKAMGFGQIGSRMDDIDGLEYVFRLDV